MADSSIMVRVVCYLGERGNPSSEPFESAYRQDTLAGEFVRNVCVNLGLDPDTHEGITRNATVHVRSDGQWQAWPYLAGRSITSQGLRGNVELLVHEVQAVQSYYKKRQLGEVAPFASDEALAISASVDCTALHEESELTASPTRSSN